MAATTTTNKFVSHIKVKGIDLLPPVITPSRSLELHSYKQQAIKLEKRLQNCKELKKSLQELMSRQDLTSSPYFEGNSHIEDLGISSARSSVLPKKKPNLSRDIIDVTEYSNYGIKLINKDDHMVFQSGPSQTEFIQGQSESNATVSIIDAYESDSSLNKSSEIPVSSVMSSAREPYNLWATPDLTGSFENGTNFVPRKSSSPKSSRSTISRNKSKSATVKSPSSPKQRLIRSNSYTLESPSPILLAHLEKCCKTNLEVPDGKLSRTWASLENNFVPMEDSEFSSLNTVYNTALDNQNVSDKVPLNKMVDEDSVPQKDTGQNSPTIEVVQTDISVQHITVNANIENIEPVKGSLDLSNPQCQLMQVLKKIPEDYSKQIIEILEKRRSEHKIKVENFGKQFKNISPDDENIEDSSSTISELSSWSNYCGIVDESEQNEMASQKISETENIPASYKSDKTHFENEPYSEVMPYNDNDITDVDKLITALDNTFDIDSKRIEELLDRNRTISSNNCNEAAKKEWAATLICAYVKGYLTRRLYHTVRIQSKIETIREAILCAIQLHKVKNFDEADAELHRRLINQVTSAMYEIHDIFFNLSVPEKMAIISADRQRLLEKSRRPSSAPDIQRTLSNSSRSSTKSFHSQTSMKI